MIRRISTKWVLAVLAAVIVPFTGLAWYVNSFVRDRIADDVVRYHLLSHASELAERLDREVEERRQDVRVLATVQEVSLFLEGRVDDREVFRGTVERLLDGFVVAGGVYDYVLAIPSDVAEVVSNAHAPDGDAIDEQAASALRAIDWGAETWFREALERGDALLDWRRLDLLGAPPVGAVPDPLDYFVGFAHRVESTEGGTVGVVLGLLSWARIQTEVETYGVRRQGASAAGPAGEDIYNTSYAWVWAADADTILAHETRALYGQSVSEPPVALPQMSAAARDSEWGMYPDYSFRGKEKKAAFRHTRSRAEGGFGWIVGVGVDFEDIYGPVRTITANLVKATALVLLVSSLITLVVARRTTRPIQELQRFMRRVAAGDLDVQVPAGGRDELGDLARSFNRMTRELKENREQLVRAEKDAAWREMARQVAHEIKNPLTPLRLSADLLERAHAQESPEFESILERTIGVVRRQCDHMREIASDFHAFAGRHREPRPVDLGRALDEVLDLHRAWALDAGVEVVRTGDGGTVLADPDELRRAFLNLVSNAFEAMPAGGRLEVEVQTSRTPEGPRVVVELRDTGPGLSEEAQERLFEPYFTTRSSGTGLGLAIVRRIVEDLGGAVTLANRAPGPGAIARLELPASGADAPPVEGDA